MPKYWGGGTEKLQGMCRDTLFRVYSPKPLHSPQLFRLASPWRIILRTELSPWYLIVSKIFQIQNSEVIAGVISLSLDRQIFRLHIINEWKAHFLHISLVCVRWEQENRCLTTCARHYPVNLTVLCISWPFSGISRFASELVFGRWNIRHSIKNCSSDTVNFFILLVLGWG